MMKRKLWFTVLVVGFVLAGSAAGIPTAAAIEGVHYDGSSQIYWAFVKDTAEMFTKETGIKVVAEDRKTQDAVPSLVSGRSNVGGLARKLKLAEKAQAQDLTETLIARDYMAVFVPKDSKVENLTLQDLKKVFSGQITDWKDIGGAPGPIQVVIPQIKTACTVNFREQVMGDAPFAKDTLITETAGAVLEAAKGKPAISYISFGAVSKTVDFKVLKIEGKQPGTAGYPLVQEMYFATKGQPEGDVKKYVEYFLKGAGKGLLEKAGLFPAQ
ncbi:MAG: substrate-binding domain-containing protein [Desulfobacterota bacterium]|jgi:phosphate transport system substrate-binding protein|nr:substrate-binding domain-containing protein [Thermodesulfobacteriota bacterium]